jgi:hypothetical protein
MRKGKMAAKMAEMKRAAELEIGDDNEAFNNTALNKGNLLVALPDGAVDSDSGPDMALPKMNFVSTRRMGPSRGIILGALSVLVY